MSNRLQNETSPYLLQHKENPVDWYPWCEEAFIKAKEEDKPIFLSIGYSSCHWCHVLAHESFEDDEIADILNKNFISIKVDKEERPDIDSVYMAVCQAFTGSGGWPTSIFMTADKKPFYAGTYFPKTSRGGMIGFKELLLAINEVWQKDRNSLLEQSDKIINYLNNNEKFSETADLSLAHSAVTIFERIYDEKNGGFGRAPKFPTPHNILFMLSYYERFKEKKCLEMAEHTLLQMYRGGIFDHIGFGFCRYSTDKKFLVPHFEKMLYDNALLILAYSKTYAITKKELYLEIAEKTATYIIREMTSTQGAFFSAQDADVEGEEGKFYLFTPDEIVKVIGEKDAENFNRHYDISKSGNFEGKNIPNLLNSDPLNKSFEHFLPQLFSYRKNRYSLHLDDKILTSWNSLMIAAMCELYRASKKSVYLEAAKRADAFIKKYLYENETLYVSFRKERRGVKGFLDDYASYIFAQLGLYSATFNNEYLNVAKKLTDKVLNDFSDKFGGFYLYSDESEELILRPKDTYDGAIPSGNSFMAYNLVRIWLLDADEKYKNPAENQMDFIATDASQNPISHAMFLVALLEYSDPPMKIIVVADENTEMSSLPLSVPINSIVKILREPTKEIPLKNNQTTYYVCKGHTCKPPVNDLNEVLGQ